MIRLAEHDLCCGCQACGNICIMGAITFTPDEEGFLRPLINVEKCVECHRCERVCPILRRNPPREPIAVYAARSKDLNLRMKSSSGGIFSLLARRTFAVGGVVYGAAIRNSDMMVEHVSAENEKELSRLRGSKYVQSDVGNVYCQAKGMLEAGRQVLFSGTPCQISAFRRVLGRSYPNLLCVDFICHAVSSPLVWARYLEKRATEKGCEVDPSRISFRDKRLGWKNFGMSLGFIGGESYLADLHTDVFLRGYLNELYNRPSCFHCVSRELRSGSDLTIADYWNVHLRFPDMDDNIGTSVIMINTESGSKAVGAIRSDLYLRDSDFRDVCRINPAVLGIADSTGRRNKFFAKITRNEDVDAVVRLMLSRPLWRRVASRIKRTFYNGFKLFL